MIRIWDIESGKQIKTIDASPGYYQNILKLIWIYFDWFLILADAWTVSFSPDGKNIASGSYTGKVNVFNLETGRKETNFQLDSKGKFTMSISYVRDFN